MFTGTNEYLSNSKPTEDVEFDKIYSEKMRTLSKRHFTPIHVAKKASEFLVDNSNLTVLDIGSGLGKFCFVSSLFFDANFVGVDFRKDFIRQSKEIAQQQQFKNVEFIYSNILDFDLENYNRLYFFNSFQEQIDSSSELDDSIQRAPENYQRFTDKLKQKLDQLPIGTKLAAYHTNNEQIPFSYKLVDIKCNGNLKFWEKNEVKGNDRFYKEMDWLKKKFDLRTY